MLFITINIVVERLSGQREKTFVLKMVGTTDVQGASNGNGVTNRHQNGSSVDNKDAALDKDRLNPHVKHTCFVIMNSSPNAFYSFLFAFFFLLSHEKCVHQMHRKSEYKTTWDDLLWFNIIYLAYLHLGGVYGLYLLFTGQCKISTVLMSKLRLFFRSEKL